MSQISDTTQGKGIRQYFRTAGRINATFDWFDFTSGIGYKNFYGGMYAYSEAGLGANVVFFLTNDSSIESGVRSISTSCASATYTLVRDYDYDTTFQNPAIIGGPSYINISAVGSVSSNSVYYFKFNIYKVSGGVETLMGSTEDGQPHATTGTIREGLGLTLNKTSFGIGDILRVNLQLYGRNKSGTAGTVTFYADPASDLTLTDSEGATIGTDFKIQIPFIVQT